MTTMNDATKSQDEDNVPHELVRLMFALGIAYAAASRELGLTSQQAQLLCAAGRLPSAGIGDLAGVMRCDRSNVSRLVDRAQKRGLVERGATAADGRVTVVALSDEGQQVVEEFSEMLETRLRALVANWPKSDRDAAATLLNRLTEALNAVPPPAAPQRAQALVLPAG